MTVILGIDPGLQNTGWGVIIAQGNALSFVACGVIKSEAKADMSARLMQLHDGLQSVVDEFAPDAAAVEEVFINKNARSSLKLGQARGIALLVPSLAGVEVAEYSALAVKQSVVGYGRADKNQIAHMVKMLLPKATPKTADAADALAVAITHAHNMKALRLAS